LQAERSMQGGSRKVVYAALAGTAIGFQRRP